MERMTFIIIVCIAGAIGAFVTLVFTHWACMVAVIIIIPAIALSLDTWRRESRETQKRLDREISAREKALDDFFKYFDMDRKRAEIVYNAGFKSMDDFRGMSIEDLMEIDDINPTIAKKIYHRMNET